MTSGVLSEPDTPVRLGWTVRLSASVLGFWLVVVTPVLALLPLHIEQLDPADKERDLAIVTAVAAVVSIVAAPICGAFSDRTTSRFGRRRPWILGGALVCAAAMAALAAQATVFGVVVCWAVAQGAQNALYSGVSATVPDQVPVRQRGFVSAFVGLPLPVALVLGTLLVTQLVTDRTGGYYLLAGLLLVCVLPFALTTKDTRLPRAERPPFRLSRFLAGFWISPRRHPDFAWAAVSRLAIQLANSIATLYLLYFLRDEVKLPDPGSGVFVLIVVYTVGILGTSVVAGRLSDRSGRRKVYVIASSCVIAVAMLILALWPTWPAAIVAAGVLGLGYGVYAAIDAALITQVLPRASDHGKDLGVLNLANTASQALAPAIAGAIIATLHSYSVLYLVAGAIALVGALLVRPIRSVR
ncbi:MFS transporter [Amycolatopsis anabasis]|uniref:MFS transporter n=1 Tax=Amycolatopsis anabasis TaxID=1840409 RepID=UPI0015D231CA|nr:MFS transporter [Amycolatopsis anabasis]